MSPFLLNAIALHLLGERGAPDLELFAGVGDDAIGVVQGCESEARVEFMSGSGATHWLAL